MQEGSEKTLHPKAFLKPNTREVVVGSSQTPPPPPPLFFYLVEMCHNNALVIYNDKQEKKVPKIDFQLAIIQSLCFPYPEEDDEFEEIRGQEQGVSPAPKHDPMSRLSGGFMDHKRAVFPPTKEQKFLQRPC